MKLKFALLFTLAALCTVACDEESERYNVRVDLQGSFNDDLVQVWIDGDKIISEQVTTDNSLGLAKIEQASKKPGNHTIKVMVNKVVQESDTFDLNEELFIAIQYNPDTHAITFLYTNEEFGYD